MKLGKLYITKMKLGKLYILRIGEKKLLKKYTTI